MNVGMSVKKHENIRNTGRTETAGFFFPLLSLGLFCVPVMCFVLLSENGRLFLILSGAAVAGLAAACIGSGFSRKTSWCQLFVCLLVFIGIGYTRAAWVRLSQTDYAAKLAYECAGETADKPDISDISAVTGRKESEKTEESGNPHVFEAVVDRAEISSTRYLFVRLTHMDGRKLDMPLLVYAENTTGHWLAQGETLVFTGKFRIPENTKPSDKTENSFDRRAWLRSKGVYGELYALAGTEVKAGAAVSETGRKKLGKILFSGAEKALDTLQGKENYEEIRAMLYGLLYGDKGDFSKSDKENFALSGLTHILCVSGLHFSLVLGGAAILAEWLVRRRKLRLILLFAASGLYLYLCGFTPSAMRAAIMMTATLFGMARKNARRCTETLLFAAAFICLVRPEAVFDIGFRLSVLSCTGILLAGQLYRIMEARFAGYMGRKFVGAAVLLSAAAYGFTYFYCQSVFGSVGLGNIMASCLGVFPAQICLVFAWLSVLIVPLIPASAGFFGTVFASFTKLILWIAAYFAKYPRIEPVWIGKLPSSVLFFGLYFLAVLAACSKVRGMKILLCIWGLVLCSVSIEVLRAAGL